MINVTPYLIFNGNCKEAMDFYKTHFGGELFSMKYGDSPEGTCPKGAEEKIVHAFLKNNNFMLMASDTPTNDAKLGDTTQLSIACESSEEVDRLYKALGEGGVQKVFFPETFWGSYFGMVTDKYGINWMLNYELPKK